MFRIDMVGLLLVGGFLSLMPERVEAQKRQRDVIKRDEILASPQKDLDLFMAVRALRPTFLEPPKGVRTLGGSMGMAPILVVIGNARQTGVDVLKSIMAQDIEEIRYLDPSQSETRFGIMANGGALVIKMHGGSGPKKDSIPPEDPLH